jgi:drug/metabolite transporter (DMT)-like permease
MPSQKLVNWLLFLALSLTWGSSFILMKEGSQKLNGLQIGAVRVLCAGLALLPVALYGIRKLPRHKLPLLLLTGTIGIFLPAFLFATAITHISSALEGILNSLTPLFVVVLGILFFKLQVKPRKLVGVLIGFVGLLLLGLSGGAIDMSNIGYALLILLATILYGTNVNLVSRYLQGMNPVHTASVSLLFIAIPALLVAWQQGVFELVGKREYTWPLVASALLGVGGTAAANVVFYLLIKRAGALFSSLVTYGIPVVAIGWGLVAGETITIVQVACLAMILLGVFVAGK